MTNPVSESFMVRVCRTMQKYSQGFVALASKVRSSVSSFFGCKRVPPKEEQEMKNVSSLSVIDVSRPDVNLSGIIENGRELTVQEVQEHLERPKSGQDLFEAPQPGGKIYKLADSNTLKPSWLSRRIRRNQTDDASMNQDDDSMNL